jgi:hypothetical protein
MTQKARQSQSSSKAAVHPVVLFGVDRHGKPTAARFLEGQARLAAKAAEQLQLRVLTVSTPAVAELAATLPMGRIHASGKGFVPHIRAELYAKLVSAAAADGANNGPPAQTPINAAPSGAPPSGNGDSRRPKNWEDIGAGHMVLAQESLEDGWYEAIVVERTGPICSMRWCDYPRERRFTRHYRALALMCPNPADVSVPTPEKPAKASAVKAGPAKPAGGAKALPKTWAEIDVGSLVLAQQDGPRPAWWEAVPTENHGDTVTVCWRDYGKLPAINRARTSLALLCPSAA